MEQGNAILENLYSLYSHVAEVSRNVSIITTDVFSIVHAQNSYWPNIVFSIDEKTYNEDTLEKMCKIISDNKLFPLVIATDNTNLTKLLRTKNFMPVEQWMGMIIELDTQKNEQTINNSYEMITYKKEDEIQQCIDIISECLFNNNKLDGQLFKSLLTHNRVELLAIRNESQTLGTTMIYYDENNLAGIYMVCTKPEHRGKGIGKILIKSAFKEICKRDIKTCVLHSTKQALSLYQKTGFEKKAPINLYWKVK